MTRVKICGITNEADMVAAIEAGADFLGFILAEKSPRYVAPDRLAALTAPLPSLDVPRIPLCCGVFVDPDPAFVVDVVARCSLQAVQMHRASAEKLRAIHHAVGGAMYPAFQPRNYDEAISLITAFGAGGDEQLDPVPAPPWLPQVLIDAYHPELAGGTGHRADLGMARRLAGMFDRLMMAGSLTPDNVADSIRAAQPWAVDVSSGVEAAPGKKDHAKVRAFIQAVRAVDEELIR